MILTDEGCAIVKDGPLPPFAPKSALIFVLIVLDDARFLGASLLIPISLEHSDSCYPLVNLNS